MKLHQNIVRFLLLLSLILIVSGCAVFEGGNVPETHLIPIAEMDEPKPSISYDINAMGGLFSTGNLPEHVQNIIAGELLQTLEKSNYFSRISKNDEEADLNLSVTIKNTGNPAAMIPAFITGLSLYTIPSFATDNFEVRAVAKNRQGHSKEYVLSDTSTLVQWLPMLFVFPVKNFSVLPEVRKNMYRNVLKQMKDDGFISGGTTVKISGADSS
ncbi:hypothetical protein [Desulfobacter curvatus]|uniref:hypothetical protein n=1 Tax=Desulfobacter curvatus TaxID=2290 RepID=UPI00035E1BB9|nr:hypothetical protein [Desulfobacter curvatus]